MNNSPTELSWRPITPLQLTPKEIYEKLLDDDYAFEGSEEICIIFETMSNSTLVDLLYDNYRLKPGTGANITNAFVSGEKRRNRFTIIVSCLRLIALEYNKDCRDSTIHKRIGFIKLFIVFANEELNSLDHARTILFRYIDNLRESIRAYKPANIKTGQPLIGISARRATIIQDNAILFIREHFNVKNVADITSGFDLISSKGSSKLEKKTQPLSVQEQSREFSYYTLLFRRLTNIILNHELLPQRIDFVDGHIWVAASGKSQIQLVEPNIAVKDGTFRRFNFINGTYYTPWAIEETRGYPLDSDELYQLKKACLDSYMSANMEKSLCRIRLAGLAAKAYFMHCLFVMGMDDSTLKTLPYSSEYKIKKSEQNFRNIKWRAKGRVVSFDIQSEFIDDFKKYLKLRKYILSLEGEDYFPFLFFGFKSNTYIPAPLAQTSTGNRICRETLIDKCPFELNPSREIRITKGLWIRKNYGPSVSAWILQHSINTAFTDYSGNNAETTKDELTDYYEALNKKIFSGTEGAISTPSGKCATPPSPYNLKADGDFLEGTPEVLKNCGKFEGCLFCHNFRLIGDEIDTRKLFSLKYVTEQCSPLARDNEHFERVHQASIDRINSLFEELIKLKPETETMVRKVENSVFNDEKLSDFWNNKLELLFDLGVL